MDYYKNFIKMLLCSVLNMAGTIAVMGVKAGYGEKKYIKHLMKDIFSTLLNFAQLYKMIEPNMMIGDTFKEQYGYIASICKSCKKYDYDKNSKNSERIYDCTQCTNYKNNSEFKELPPEILNCSNYDPDCNSIIELGGE